MQELLQQLLKEIQSAWRFRWHALVLAWTTAIFGWCAVLLTPNVYESQAKVFVDTESLLKPLLSGLAVTTNVTSQVNMMSAVLMARPNIEKVAKDTDLYLRARTPKDMDKLLAALPKQVSLAADRDSTYTIAYRDHDPRMAHRVVRRFLDTFVEDALGVKREDSAGTEDFLRQRLQEYEQKLRAAEDRLAEFKKQNVGLMPSETGDYYTRLQTAMTAQEDLQSRLRDALAKRTELERQLEGEEPTFGLAPNTTAGPSGPNDALIAQYRAQLETLLVQYTDKHPQVIALRETIAQLEEENRKATANGQLAMPQTVDPSTLALRKLDINPVYQSMKILLSQLELEVVELRNKLATQQALVHDLRARINTIPEVEAQLVRLNRDYEVNSAQYKAILQSLERAKLSGKADESSNVKFRVIEPPRVPLNPVSPNRPLLLSIVLLAALGAGAALAVLLNQLKPVFSNRASLAQATGLPVLGAISSVLSAKQLRTAHLRPAYYAGGVALLLAAFVATLLFANSASDFARMMLG